MFLFAIFPIPVVHGDAKEAVGVGLGEVRGREHSGVEHLLRQDVTQQRDVVSHT